MSSLTYIPVLVLALFAVESAYVAPPACSADETEPWSYRGSQNGPSQWGRLYPSDCSGSSQSPINIDYRVCRKNRILPPLVLTNYDVPLRNATMVNIGYTVQIMPGDNVRRTIVVDGVEYDLVQFHFHWGLNRYVGSEHTINRKSFAMELHLVHLAADGRIAVVGVFLKEYIFKQNKGLQPIVNSFPDVMYESDVTILRSPLVLNDLLPNNPASYYRYNGSLTTPACTEGVTWSVLTKPIAVGKTQMKGFRSLFSVNRALAQEANNQGCLIAPNYRPTLPLNGRQVLCSL